MTRTIALVAFLVVALPVVTQAQSEANHIYQVIEWRALPGMEAEYSQSYHDYLRPIWSEVVRRGGMVSYLDLAKRDGDQTSGSHLLLVEWESQQSFDNWGQALEEASQSVIGRSWADISENVFLPLRGPNQVRAVIYTAPPGS